MLWLSEQIFNVVGACGAVGQTYPLCFRDFLAALPVCATSPPSILDEKFMNLPEMQFRLWSSSDSLDELTWLLRQAYAPLGAAGLNYTAVNQTADVTQSRISKGQCLLALMEGVMVGSVVVAPPRTQSLCPHFNQPDVASINQFAVLPTYHRAVGSALVFSSKVKRGHVPRDINEWHWILPSRHTA